MIKNILISSCKSLQYVPTGRFGDLLSLDVLRVLHCPMIKSQHLFASSLKKLDLENSWNLGGNIECSSLTILHLSHNPLESMELQMWNLPLMQELEISYCPSPTIIKDLEPMSLDVSHGGARSRMGKFLKLTHLSISHCDKLETVDDLIYLPAIESIVIWACGLLYLPANRLGGFPRLKRLDISICQRLD
jgi:Leucine-rich repeat (LRR) protein